MNSKNYILYAFVMLFAIAGQGALLGNVLAEHAEECTVVHAKPSMPSKTALVAAIVRDISCAAGSGALIGSFVGYLNAPVECFRIVSVPIGCCYGTAGGAGVALIVSPIVRGYLYLQQAREARFQS